MKRSLICLTSAFLVALASLLGAPALADEPPAAPSVVHVAPPAARTSTPAPAEVNDALKEAGITPEIAQRLTGDQIFEILRRRSGNDDLHGEGILVPLAFFLFTFLGVTVGLYIAFRKDRERQETLRAMIQRGETIPPHLLVPPVKKFNDLRRGIILIAGGLGLAIFIGVMPTDRGVWTVGVIPMLLGAGYLLAWRLMRPGAPGFKDEAQIAAEREVNSL
jgi:hypothetical protein